jgi:hypothetical protein
MTTYCRPKKQAILLRVTGLGEILPVGGFFTLGRFYICNEKVAYFLDTFYTKSCALWNLVNKMAWAAFWVIFSHTQMEVIV